MNLSMRDSLPRYLACLPTREEFRRKTVRRTSIAAANLLEKVLEERHENVAQSNRNMVINLFQVINNTCENIAISQFFHHRFIGRKEWECLLNLTSFSRHELEKLNAVFVVAQKNGLIEQHRFWKILLLSKNVMPVADIFQFKFTDESIEDKTYLQLYWNTDSFIGKRLFKIFAINALNFLEFAMAISVLCSKAKFQSRTQLMFECFEILSDQNVHLQALIQIAYLHAGNKNSSNIIAAFDPRSILEARIEGSGVVLAEKFKSCFTRVTDSAILEREGFQSMATLPGNEIFGDFFSLELDELLNSFLIHYALFLRTEHVSHTICETTND